MTSSSLSFTLISFKKGICFKKEEFPSQEADSFFVELTTINNGGINFFNMVGFSAVISIKVTVF